MANRPEQLIRLGDDMTEAANIGGFRNMQEGTSNINGLTFAVGAPSEVDAVFQMNINDRAYFADEDRPVLATGDSTLVVAGLDIDISQFAKIAFDLVEGTAKTPIEIGISFTDTGGGGGGDGTIAGKEVETPDTFVGKNGYLLQFSEDADKWQVLAREDTPLVPPPDLPTGLPIFAAYEAHRETAYINGDSVGQATDFASGHDRHALQATGGLKPIYATNQLNHRAGYVFDRLASQVLNVPNMTALTESEIWHVVQITTPGGSSDTAIHQFGSDSSSNHYPYTDGNNYDNGGSNSRKSWAATGADSRVFHLGAWVNKSGEFTYYYNGTQKYTTGSNTPSLISAPTIAKAGSVYASMILLATYIFDTKLTSGQRTDMKGYVHNVFGLTIA